MLLLAISPWLFAALDFSGGLEFNSPIGNTERFIASGNGIRLALGKDFFSSEIGITYSYKDFGGKGNIAYQLKFHQLALNYGYHFLKVQNSKLGLFIGTGYNFINRKYLKAKENGTGWAITIGPGFSQSIERFRFYMNLSLTSFWEGRKGPPLVLNNSANIIGLYLGIGYAL